MFVKCIFGNPCFQDREVHTVFEVVAFLLPHYATFFIIVVVVTSSGLL